MGSLQVGSPISDTEGGIQFVTAIHPQGIKEIYEITFSDGSKVEATADHLWKLDTGRVIPTSEIATNLQAGHTYTLPQIQTPPPNTHTSEKIHFLSISHIGKKPAQCITVSHPNHLYLTNNLIPTHNSADTAAYAICFFYANPTERNVTIASVTMESLLTRVWGYLTTYIRTASIPLPHKYLTSKPPKVLYPIQQANRYAIKDDTIHGIFAVTAKKGDSDQTISTWIGKHPQDKILLILDECTDMPINITKAFANLNSHSEKFQLIGIGNSDDTTDLHGTLSTPQAGWDSISIETPQWPTTLKNGICLYFSPYDSPAITDPDPLRRQQLEKFLIGHENLLNKEIELGKNSEQFYRFVLGFWKSKSAGQTVISEKTLDDPQYYEQSTPIWSGFYPFIKVAGLDPAFSVDGDNAILRILTIGHSIDNKLIIDAGNTQSLYYLKMTRDLDLVTQLVDQSFDILKYHKIPLSHLAIDVTGQGRALGTLFIERNRNQGFPLGDGHPLKLYSMAAHNKTKKYQAAQDIYPTNSYELWNSVLNYIQHKTIFNLDPKTIYQFTNRKIIRQELNGKLTHRLESKREYKNRTSAYGQAHSPDEADATALGVQVIERILKISPGETWAPPAQNNKPLSILTAQKLAMLNKSQEQLRPNIQHAITPSFSGSIAAYAKFHKPF